MESLAPKFAKMEMEQDWDDGLTTRRASFLKMHWAFFPVLYFSRYHLILACSGFYSMKASCSNHEPMLSVTLCHPSSSQLTSQTLPPPSPRTPPSLYTNTTAAAPTSTPHPIPHLPPAAPLFGAVLPVAAAPPAGVAPCPPELVPFALAALPVYGAALTPVPFVQLPGCAAAEKVTSAHYSSPPTITISQSACTPPFPPSLAQGGSWGTHVVQPPAPIPTRNHLHRRIHPLFYPLHPHPRPHSAEAEFPESDFLDRG